MDYYTEQLQELQRQKARKNRLDIILKDLYDQREELSGKVRQLGAEKQSEQIDVDKLEGRSLAAFFYGVIGKKDEKLDKERAEAYAAAVKYDAAARELEAVEDEIRRSEAERSGLQWCDLRYEQTLKEKAESIKSSANPEAEEILQLEERIFYIDNQKREIQEAISAGQRARMTTEGILSSLGSAEGWGTWDMLGGGLVTDMVKHSHLDNAQNQVEQLQVELRQFKTELSDVTIQADMQVNIDGFLRFADYFFDGLFADWAVLDKIKESQGQVQRTKEQIETILTRLDTMQAEAEQQQTELKSRLDELILKVDL